MADLIEHLESHLGSIHRGWSRDADGNRLPFQIISCQGGKLAHTSFYSTLGLSKIALPSRVSPKTIRQELVLGTHDSFGSRNIPGILQQVANEAIARNSAYLRGDLIGPRGTLFHGMPFEALYVTNPSFLDDDFAVCTLEDGHQIVIGWLIPVTKTEAVFIKERGWNEFEDELAAAEIDPTDLCRPNIFS